MREVYKIILMALIGTAYSYPLIAQNNFFTDAGENTVQHTAGKRVIIPEKYRSSGLNIQGMKNFLWSLPAENSLANRQQASILELPMPGGGTAKFHVWESSIMEPALEEKFPEIRTFLGQGIDDPYATIRFDYNPYFGFSAQILSIHGNIYIDPYARGDINNYISYYSRENKRNPSFVCEVPAQVPGPNIAQRAAVAPCRGTQLYSYRLAVACTGEYSVAVCSPAAPTVSATLAAMVTSVNRVTGVYETELAVRLILIGNDNLLINLDGTTDLYDNDNPGGILLGQNQDNIDAVIGSANYDIGHVFSTGGGGIARVGVVCDPALKSFGVTGTSNPVGDAFDIDYVAHEMGHQFGGLHAFNGVVSNCGAQSSSSAAYEVGSGTTIMCYAGICGSDNIQLHSDPFFHAISFDEISDFVQTGGSGCKASTNTFNTLPVIISMDNNGVSIPISTPFTLTGSAFDPDSDPITYCWEELDLGPGTAWNGGNANTTSPLFKSRPPKTSGSRTFPDISVILAGYPANPSATIGGLKGETLPTVARALKFRLTVRDNRAGGGGVVSGGNGCQAGFTNTFQINTVATSGPFAVTIPNGGENYPGGSSQMITWNVVGTDQAPISCANVKISLSTDGGLTYPTVLSASTPNDGSEVLVIPSVFTSAASIKVEAVGNIFFDISNSNFTISVPIPSFDFNFPAAANIACPPPASASITLATISNLGFVTPVNLSASGTPAGTSVSFGTNPVTPGLTTTVTLNNTNTLSNGTYTVAITGVGGAITRTRVLTFIVQSGTGPVINTQPASQNVCAGGTASFSIAATGSSGYQWQKSTDGGVTFNDIAGATGTTYTIVNVQISDDGSYRNIATGTCNTTTSSVAILKVQILPAITSPPQSVTLCIGSNNTFSVVAAGTNITYQWQLSTDGGSSFNDIPAATSISYTVNGITADMNNYRYRLVVSGTCAPPAASNPAILTVITPVSISTQPVNTEMCSASNTSFKVVGSSAETIIYQWQLSTDAGVSYNNIANTGVYTGATTAMLTITGATIGLNNDQYRCLVSSATCSVPTVSNAAILTVRQQPSAGFGAAPLTSLLPGQSTSLTASPSASTGGTLSITWVYNTVTVPNSGNSRIVTVEQTGNYQVGIKEIWPSSLACSNQSPVVTIGAPASGNLFIFPSPNSGQFVVSYYNASGTSTSRAVTIYDSHGAKIHHQKFTIAGPYTLFSINLKPAQGGVYFVVVGDANGKKLAEGKVMVQ